MPFARPTLQDLRQQARAAFVTRLGLLVATLVRWVIGDMADILAGMVSGQYGYLNWMVRQLYASTADGDYLDRMGGELGVNRKGASPAAGNVIFTGLSGSVIAAGTPLQTTDGAASYTVTTAGTLSGGTVTLAVLAATAGASGNQAAGGTLTLVNAIGGVTATATIAAGGLTGGLDQEGDAAFSARILARKRNPPQGGSRTDYVEWAKTVPACTRAWSLPRRRGGNTIDVLFVCDGRTNIIPTAGDIADVQAAIDVLRPGQVDCFVFAPIPDAVPVTLTSLTPNNVDTQAAVRAALAALFSTTTPGGAKFGDGVSEAAPGGALPLERVYSAITGAAGVTAFDISTPAADVVAATSHIIVLGTVTLPAIP